MPIFRAFLLIMPTLGGPGNELPGHPGIDRYDFLNISTTVCITKEMALMI